MTGLIGWYSVFLYYYKAHVFILLLMYPVWVVHGSYVHRCFFLFPLKSCLIYSLLYINNNDPTILNSSGVSIDIKWHLVFLWLLIILLVFLFCVLEYYSVSMHCVPIWIFISSAAVDIFIEVTTGLVEHITSSNISRSKRISYFLVLTGHFCLKCVNLPHSVVVGVASP